MIRPLLEAIVALAFALAVTANGVALHLWWAAERVQ